MNRELAEQQAREIAAKIIQPYSYYHFPNLEFPGMDKLGLDPDDAHDKKMAAAIFHAINIGMAGTNWDQSYPFGSLATMLEYGIITLANINQALHIYYNNTHKH
jgi:hypothetical protein